MAMKGSKLKGPALLMFLLMGIGASAQQYDFKHDLEIINKKLSEEHADPYRRPYIYKNEPSLIKKLNPVNIVFGTSLYVYQNIFSRQISANCLYTPSCSEFSKDAIREYGALKGAILSVDRLKRCNVLAAMDLNNHSKDPVTNRYPDPASRYKKVKNHDGR
jgi:putative membrane protein insertion efficiency factor